MDLTTAVTHVRQAAAEVDHAVEAVAQAKEALQRVALRALVDAADDAALEALIQQLYWNVPELPVKTFEAVVGGGARVRQIAGLGPAIGTCQDCDEPIHAVSRTQLTTRPACCKRCDSVREQARRARDLHRWNSSWSHFDDDDDGPVPPEWYDDLEPPEESWYPV